MGKNYNSSRLVNGLSVDANGNVGVGGNPNASYKLAVTGTGNFTGALRTSSTFTSGDTIQLGLASTDGGFWTWGASNSFLVAATGKALNLNPNGSTGTTGLSIATTGAATFSSNVGIGGVTLASWYTGYAAMQIGASASIFGNKTTSDTNTTQLANNAYLNTGATAWQYINTDEATRYEQVNGEHNFYSVASGSAGANITWGTPKLTIASTGNVGIGTSSPLQTNTNRTVTTINGTNDAILNLATGGTLRGYIYVDSSSYTELYSVGQLALLSNASQPMTFATNGSERMRITSGGNVLIGTTSNPSNYKFVVNSTAYVPQFIAFGVNDDGRYIGQGNQISGAFQANDIAIVNYAPTNTRIVIANYSTGVALNNGATSWSSFSDERLKNITGNIENAVDKLLSIRAVNYSWKTDETNKENLGLIAQDVEKVFPQVIDESKSFNEGDDTEYLSIRYSELIPVLVKAIQELSAKVTALENANVSLKVENDELRSILTRNNLQ